MYICSTTGSLPYMLPGLEENQTAVRLHRVFPSLRCSMDAGGNTRMTVSHPVIQCVTLSYSLGEVELHVMLEFPVIQ